MADVVISDTRQGNVTISDAAQGGVVASDALHQGTFPVVVNFDGDETIFFDATHDNMTDVWQFNRVVGEERHGHATPKPVEMIKRAVMTSSEKRDLVISPFLGSGSDLVACEQLNRKCRGVEISPAYIAVTLERWSEATGQTPELITDD